MASSTETKTGSGSSEVKASEVDSEQSHFTHPPTTFRVLRVTNTPKGVPQESDFKLEDVTYSGLTDGQFLVRVHFYSVDPYYRLFVKTGEILTGAGVGTVVASKSAVFPVGSVVSGRTCAAEYVVVSNNGAKVADIVDDSGWRVLSPELGPYSTAVSVLGMPGATAWIGVKDGFAALPKGASVIVSGAAGQVGSYVGQLLKRQGMRVIGIAGGPEKCEKLKSLGFDVALDYKRADLADELKKAVPEGADGYWDNVGGDVELMSRLSLKKGGMFVKCGGISTYNDDVPFANKWSDEDKKKVASLELKEYKTEVFSNYPRWEDAFNNMSAAIKAGELKYEEHVVDGGLSVVAAVLAELFRSGGVKKLVRISKPPSPAVLAAITPARAADAPAPKTSIP